MDLRALIETMRRNVFPAHFLRHPETPEWHRVELCGESGVICAVGLKVGRAGKARTREAFDIHETADGLLL